MAACKRTCVKRKRLNFCENNGDNESVFDSDDSMKHKTFKPRDSSFEGSEVLENSVSKTTMWLKTFLMS